MSEYPTPSDYQEALQTPSVAFADAELQEASPRRNALGLPQPITGSFAAVFPVETPSGRYAVKCFRTHVPNQQKRYEAIADKLDKIGLDACVEFVYQPDGIRVDGEAFPLLKMEWAEGPPLNRFVRAHLDQPDVLQELAEAWANLLEKIEALDFAHGDLQHGNVLVAVEGEQPSFRLVDYDTAYVPALDGWSSPEVGHRNYQHPDRTDADFGPRLDRFSSLVVYVALEACAHVPHLWDQYNTGENLLFRAADFFAPETSALFDDLEDVSAVSDLAEGLKRACYIEVAEVPSLEDVRDGTADSEVFGVPRRRSVRGDGRERSPFARGFLPGTIAAGVVVVVAGLLGGPLVGAGVLLVSVGAAGSSALAHYRQLSLVRRRQRLEQEIERFTTTIRELEREKERLKERREALRRSLTTRREEHLEAVQKEALNDCLKHHFIGEIRAEDGLTHKHVVALKAAGIRTAAEATPGAIENVRRMSRRAKGRVKEWRASLEKTYADEIPDTLSPAQERRVERHVEHRVDDVESSLRRIREKIETQTLERERVRERLDDTAHVSFLRYLGYLLRLTTLPVRASDRPVPDRSGTPNSDAQTSVPARQDGDGPWWGDEG